MATYPIKDFVKEIDLALSKMRHNELQMDYTSKHTWPELPPPNDVMRHFYEHVLEIYTRHMYNKVVEAISKENAYSVTHHVDHEDYFLYTLKKFRHGQICHKVQCYVINNHLKCSCMLFDTDGYPCRYIWVVMKHVDIRVTPRSLLLKRWRKDANNASQLAIQHTQARDTQRELVEMSRYGSLKSSANLMNFYASKVESSFNIAKEERAKFTAAFKEAHETQLKSDDAMQCTTYGHHANPNIIRDPVIVRSKRSRLHGSGRVGFSGPSAVPPARP